MGGLRREKMGKIFTCYFREKGLDSRNVPPYSDQFCSLQKHQMSQFFKLPSNVFEGIPAPSLRLRPGGGLTWKSLSVAQSCDLHIPVFGTLQQENVFYAVLPPQECKLCESRSHVAAPSTAPGTDQYKF